MTQIFIDVDGVVADFDKRSIEILGMTMREFEDKQGQVEAWKRLYATPDFFYTLDPMADAHYLVGHVFNMCLQRGLTAPIFLTGCPRGEWAQPQKQRWKEKYFPHLEMICTASATKVNYMKPGDIIIDDWERHKPKWEAAGGHWILHKSAEQSLQELQQLLVGKYG
jgi:hypothetical protein